MQASRWSFTSARNNAPMTPARQSSLHWPPFLKKGDMIGLVAPARKIHMKEIEEALRVFNSWGLEVICAPHLFGDHNQFSGTDKERLDDLQQMLDHPDIRAVVCVRGGYGSLRLIDAVDWRGFRKNPKWIVGFSDVTVFHAHLQQQLKMVSLHGIMPLNMVKGDGMLPRKKALQSLKDGLFGKTLAYKISAHPLNRPGNARGTLIGGNLSLLYALQGSTSDIDTRGKILFIEDLDEYLYHIDRMILSLCRAGKFRGLRGLIVGGMTEMRDNKIPFGKSAPEIIAEHTAEYDFPICFGFPAGHQDDNRALLLGAEVSLTVEKKGSALQFIQA